MNNGVTKFAQDTGNDAVEKGPTELDAAQQAQVMEDMIAQGVDAICVVPIDPSSLESVCKKAKAAGIVVIAQEASTLQNCDYDVEAFNNKQYGAFMMDNLAQAMGQSGTYTTMVAALTNASQNEWADGAVERAKSAYTNMKLLDAEPRVESDGNSDTAYQKTKELIKKYPDLKGIVGSSSYDAPGVARAIEELGLKGKFFTSGTGMPQENAQILKDGDVTALTLWDPADAGYAMCSLAVKVLNGEKIQDGLNLGIKGYDSLKFASGSTKVLEGTGWITITKDNVDSFGF
jgi:ABC-type sugar transport system, periplasmic component